MRKLPGTREDDKRARNGMTAKREMETETAGRKWRAVDLRHRERRGVLWRHDGEIKVIITDG